jgi:hypothetical protein
MDSRVKEVVLKSGYKLYACNLKLLQPTQQMIDRIKNWYVYISVSGTNYQNKMLIVRFRTLLDQIPIWSCKQTVCLKVLKMANFLFSSIKTKYRR